MHPRDLPRGKRGHEHLPAGDLDSLRRRPSRARPVAPALQRGHGPAPPGVRCGHGGAEHGLHPARVGLLPRRPTRDTSRGRDALGRARRPPRLGDGELPVPLGVLPLRHRLPVGLPALRRRARARAQPLPLGGVLPVVDADDRPHRARHRHHRPRGTDRHRVRQHRDDPLRVAHGGLQQRPDARSRPVAGPGRAGLVDTVLVRLRRRHRPVAGDRGVPVGLDRCARRPGPPGVRLGHPHQPVRAVQHLRAQPVAPVPPGQRWRDYLFSEWQYVILSLVAKSVLAWQIFANTLIPT